MIQTPTETPEIYGRANVNEQIIEVIRDILETDPMNLSRARKILDQLPKQHH